MRINAANGETVEANHHLPLTANVRLRATGFLVHQGIALQKLVQCSLPTIESIDLIRCKQFTNGRVAVTQSSTPGSRSNFFRRGLAATWRSSAS